jgi:glycosyltransferase involved in cell wall biosynthesis
MRKPTLSIGLPVYNGQRYLDRCLESLLGQDFEDFELIVSDNGSTDRTETICQEFARKDPRIRYFRNDENLGATWNFRRVAELAEGDYFKFAAYDDECYPTMFRRCMEVINAGDPTIALVYTQSEFIDEDSVLVPPDPGISWDRVATAAKTPHQRLATVLWRVLHGHAHYGVMRVAFLRRARPYGAIAADWVLLAELAMMGTIVEIPEVLFRLRKHPANSWSSNKPLQVLLWHNPTVRGADKVLPFRIAIIWQYIQAIRHRPLPPSERMMCLTIACVLPPLRSVWIWLLRKTGPLRSYLRAVTGWKALCPSGGRR